MFFSRVEQIKPKEVEKLIKEDKSVVVIDVREKYEVKTGKIPQAIHIALGSLESKLDKLDKNKTYIMVCQSGNRSSMAATLLHKKGFKVKNMTGGMFNWEGKIK